MNTRPYWLVIFVLSVCFPHATFSEEAGAFPIVGRVVDDTACPVQGAEVVVYQREYRDREYTAEVIGPIVKTDREGRFALQADVTSQYNVFIVARKAGLAMAWDGLNYGGNTLGKGHFLLVLEKPHTLKGVVVDSQGRPVSGAAVQAVPKTSYMYRLCQRPIIAPKEWFTASTDREGVFHFDAFAVDVSSDFWVKAPHWECTYKFTTHYQSSCGYEVGRENIRLVLPQESPVRGRVVNAKARRPVAGVPLRATPDRERGEIKNRYLSQTVVTDASGAFTYPGLPEGKNKIAPADVDEGACSWVAEPVTVDVVPGQPVDSVTVSVEQDQAIECAVRHRATSRPLPGMRASVYTEDHSIGWESVTDEKGVARMRVLPGRYRLYVGGKAYEDWQGNKPVVVTDGQTVRVDVLLDPAPSLEGLILGPDGRPVEDVLVAVHPGGDKIYSDRQGLFTAGYEERDASEGLCIMARDRDRSLAAVTFAKQFDTPLRLSLAPATIARGRITDPHGSGIPAARVTVSILVGNYSCRIGEEVLADSEGRFECRGLPPAQGLFDYHLAVNAGGYAPKIHREVPLDGDTVDLEPMPLRPSSLSVSGMVVDANDTPVPQMIILLSGLSGMAQPQRSTATDEKGRFTMTRIAKGPIRLRAGFANGPRGSGTLKAVAGDRDVKIVLGQSRVHERYKSLVGTALPDVSEFGIELNDVKVKGKPTLVCFFDRQQRPSRHTIAQLSRQFDTLKNQGVATILVDLSGADRARFVQWVVERKIRYPVGAVREEVERKRLRWGVKSLPWLVLADGDHIVRAEGFGWAELETQIRNMASPAP